MRRLGVGYRKPLDEWLKSCPVQVNCVEVTAEHFFDAQNEQTLRWLGQQYPVFVHGLGLSLGTPGALCQDTLEQFACVAKLANARWVSEHVAFTKTDEVDLGHLNPLPCNSQSLAVLVDHAIETAERCNRKLLLENITSSLQIEGDLLETEFLNELCEQSGCGLLLDVTNLFINSKNHNYDPLRWLQELAPKNIVQLHVVGYSQVCQQYLDHHCEQIQPDLFDLIAAVVEYAPVEAIILERDDSSVTPGELEDELTRLESTLGSD